MPQVFPTNKVKALHREGKPAIGAFCPIHSAQIIEIMGYAGLDFVIIDTEHGPAGVETVEHLCRAAELGGMMPFVRVTNNTDPTIILRALDAGAMGVQIPMIESGEQAARVARGARYNPLGTRGLAGTRATRYGSIPLAEYVKAANEEVAVIVQIETVKGVENATEIAKAPGVDIVFIGPVDLSLALGIPGQVGSPLHTEYMDKAINAVIAAGKPVGSLTFSTEHGQEQIARGMQYLCINAVPVYAHCRNMLQQLGRA